MIEMNANFTAYQKGKYCALSSVVNVYDEHLPPHDEWLVSFSILGRKVVPDTEIKALLKDFGAEDFLEDNHEAGVARKFWMAVDPKYRIPCPCQNEQVIVNGDYKYSVEKEQQNDQQR